MLQKDFQRNLQKYAALIVKVGVNVQKGQTVVLQVNTEQRELAYLIMNEAYKVGAGRVIVKWLDDEVSKAFLRFADDKWLENVPASSITETDEWLAEKACRIRIISEDPDQFAGIDTSRVATYAATQAKALIHLRTATQANKVAWSLAAAAGTAWSAKVFPDLSSEKEQVDALWDMIFTTCRVYEEDPIKAWQNHDDLLETKADELNKQQFDALHYTGPGTDFTIGLPEGHLWEGAGSFDAQGVKFMANMPTEEVFTAPDARRADGTVVSTKPLSYQGNIISGMSFTFKDGAIVSASAEEGEAVLLDLLAIDEGTKRLGEVALVPDGSPISQSGVTFFNTLFDENASNHLAIGSAYPFNLKGGTEMNEDELKEAGLNRSHAHVDFMIGSSQMNVDGIKKDGTIVPIFRNGNWA